MTNKSLLFLAGALAGVAFVGNAFAYSPKDSAGPATTPAPRVIPSSVVRPTGLPLNFAGAVINVEFSLDQAGQPRDIQVLWVGDPVLKRQLIEAFRQWRFAPGVSAPATSPKRFILPIELRLDV